MILLNLNSRFIPMEKSRLRSRLKYKPAKLVRRQINCAQKMEFSPKIEKEPVGLGDDRGEECYRDVVISPTGSDF